MTDWKLPIRISIIKSIEVLQKDTLVTFYDEDLDEEITTSLPMSTIPRGVMGLSVGDECKLRICIKDKAIKELGPHYVPIDRDIILRTPIDELPYSSFYVEVMPLSHKPKIKVKMAMKSWSVKEKH